MYDFIKNMWIMKKFDATNIAKCVTKNYISQDEANAIMAMEQITINSATTTS